jgi:hypothetical protein
MVPGPFPGLAEYPYIYINYYDILIIISYAHAHASKIACRPVRNVLLPVHMHQPTTNQKRQLQRVKGFMRRALVVGGLLASPQLCAAAPAFLNLHPDDLRPTPIETGAGTPIQLVKASPAPDKPSKADDKAEASPDPSPNPNTEEVAPLADAAAAAAAVDTVPPLADAAATRAPVPPPLQCLQPFYSRYPDRQHITTVR